MKLSVAALLLVIMVSAASAGDLLSGDDYFSSRTCFGVADENNIECCKMATLCLACLGDSDCYTEDSYLRSSCPYWRCPPGFQYVAEWDDRRRCVKNSVSEDPFTSLRSCVGANSNCLAPLQKTVQSCNAKLQTTLTAP